MRAALAIALCLAACGGAPFLGSWRFQSGEASVSCDAGASPATYLLGPVSVDRGPPGELVADYVAGCPLALRVDGETAVLDGDPTCDARLYRGDAGVSPSVEAVARVESLTLTPNDGQLALAYRARVEASGARCTEQANGVLSPAR